MNRPIMERIDTWREQYPSTPRHFWEWLCGKCIPGDKETIKKMSTTTSSVTINHESVSQIALFRDFTSSSIYGTTYAACIEKYQPATTE